MRRTEKKYNHRRGFTLIELLIVIAISSLLMALVITYSGTGRNEVSLSVESVALGQTIARAKALAVTSYRTTGSSGPHPCGYGVVFDTNANTYSLVSYEPSVDNGICPSALSVSQNGVLGSELSSYSVDTWQQSLANGVTFAPGSSDATLILFYPPDPTTLVSTNACTPGNGGCSYGFVTQQGTVPITTIDGAASNIITVGTEGQISW